MITSGHTAAEPRNNEPRTILVVDDDLSVLGVIRAMLESGEYNILLAHSADIALHFVQRDDLNIDLMLVDVMMPGMSGPELADKIMGIRPHLKVLFMSGFADSEVVRVKILDRALGFLPKPFTSDGLMERVTKVLEDSDRQASTATMRAGWR
jgi:two-component system cell cycle sensor histidine kinase/response regulator CckA